MFPGCHSTGRRDLQKEGGTLGITAPVGVRVRIYDRVLIQNGRHLISTLSYNRFIIAKKVGKRKTAVRPNGTEPLFFWRRTQKVPQACACGTFMYPV